MFPIQIVYYNRKFMTEAISLISTPNLPKGEWHIECEESKLLKELISKATETTEEGQRDIHQTILAKLDNMSKLLLCPEESTYDTPD